MKDVEWILIEHFKSTIDEKINSRKTCKLNGYKDYTRPLEHENYTECEALRNEPFLIELNKFKQTDKKNTEIELIGSNVIFKETKMKKVLSAFIDYKDWERFGCIKYPIERVAILIGLTDKLLHKTKSKTTWQYSMKLDDYNRFKAFMNPTPEPQALSHQPALTNKSNSSPTNISIPSNETKLYRSGCYLIQRQNDSMFKRVKIGKGKDVLKRINGEMAYKNCVIISINHVDLNKLNDCEREIIQTFTERFKLIKEAEEGITGNETFEIYDLFETKKLFDSICEKYFI